MKKALAIVVSIFLLMAVFAGSASAAVAGDDPKNQVKIAKGTPVIDGTMDDCYTVSDKITTPYPNAGVEGTSFATFEGYAVYDSEAFYLWGHVSDPTLSANEHEDGWNGDSIEIFFNYDLEDGTGAAEEDDVYTDGVAQFRLKPLPLDGTPVITVGGGTTGASYASELGEDAEKNPQNYYIKADADNKGYVIECKFPFPSGKKNAGRADNKIGFSVQVNDAQDGSPTENAERTGTVHFQDGDQFEQCWQYAGAFGRAIFTDAEYKAPEPETEAPVADVVPEAEPETAPPAAPVADNSPKTGGAGILTLAAVMAIAAAGVAISKRKAGR